MIKVGILMNSTNCNKYIYDLAKVIAEERAIELYLLVNRPKQMPTRLLHRIISRIKNEGLIRIANKTYFRYLVKFERFLLSLFSRSEIGSYLSYNINSLSRSDLIYLTPILSKSGLVVQYADEDINRLTKLGLDIILRGNAGGIFRGKILTIAKEGIISFHHGDNRWNRGGPAGFWEVYFRKPSTGFIIQRLTNELDGGQVLFRGETLTCRTFSENTHKVQSESIVYLTEMILNYEKSKILPTPEDDLPFYWPILTTPTIIQAMYYQFKTFKLYSSTLIRNNLFKFTNKPNVAFVKGSWRTSILRKGVKIVNPSSHFFADPFVCTKNGQTVCFVEDFSYIENKGCIVAIEIVNGKSYKILGPVIQEKFHVSFPYIFEFKNQLYMLPETLDNNSIRLYKCDEYPLKWSYCHDVISNISAVDPMMFQYNGQWCLLANVREKNNEDIHLKLNAYFSDNPLSKNWKNHVNNPVVFDSRIARNGGIIICDSIFPIRCRQERGYLQYGVGLSLATITDLSTSAYRENEICKITPRFWPKLTGLHHFHSNGIYTVFDYFRNERRII